MPEIRLASLTVPRTARYAAFGPAAAEASEWWIVIHGYGQLAADFLATCRGLDDGRRLVVAPEALSRFYDTTNTGQHPDAPVGASWMTREDRESEIGDYVGYLDRVLRMLGEGHEHRPPVHVLAFSQGTATGARWVVRGEVRPVRFVCWGGQIAHDIDLVSPASPLRNTRLQLVVGSRDKWATPEVVAKEQARLAAAGLPYEGISFEGGHRLDDKTLAALAADSL